MGEVRQRGQVWWIRYYRHGRRYEESSGSDKKGKAIDLLRIREGDISRGLPITPKVGRLTFDEAANDLIADYETNGKRSLSVARRRVEKHLAAYFDGWRLANITTADVRAYVAHRQVQGVVNRHGVRIKDVSNAEINRELALLKRMFTLAIQATKLLHRPHIPLLQERNVRAGFFEPEQFASARAHLPAEIGDVVEFAYITGWRIPSEVLPLQWRNVDFAAGEVRLDAHTTKNGRPRTFPMTDDLRALLQARHAEAQRLKRTRTLIVPLVFWRMVATGRRGPTSPRPIVGFLGAWKAATRAAGCPGRIPHDFRRTAIRNMVRRGVPERVAMALTGHETRSVFDRYNVTSPGDLRTAADQLAGLTGTGKGQSAPSTPRRRSESA